MNRHTDNRIETLPREWHSLIASDRVEGRAVLRPDGRKLGTIERLMIDKRTGAVAYAVVAHGGFLGIGEKHVPLPWECLTYDDALGAYHADLSTDDLDRLPDDDTHFDWGYRNPRIEVRNYYQGSYWGGY